MSWNKSLEDLSSVFLGISLGWNKANLLMWVERVGEMLTQK